MSEILKVLKLLEDHEERLLRFKEDLDGIDKSIMTLCSKVGFNGGQALKLREDFENMHSEFVAHLEAPTPEDERVFISNATKTKAWNETMQTLKDNPPKEPEHTCPMPAYSPDNPKCKDCPKTVRKYHTTAKYKCQKENFVVKTKPPWVCCKEQRILHEGGMGVAWETFCPTHGYKNDCYVCHEHEGMLGTESCLYHRKNPRVLEVNAEDTPIFSAKDDEPEYCCIYFKVAVSDGSIRRDPGDRHWLGPKYRPANSNFPETSWILYHCPFQDCGKELK